jgi:tRNA-(ms[2]io[6]A)-hydroxylase
MSAPHLNPAEPLPATSAIQLDLAPTPAGWLETVLADFDRFLKDHASCEKKASGMALNMASHYPDRPGLLMAMADLAVEELNHYREVLKLLASRGSQPGADSKDPYIRSLNDLIRRGPEHFLLDRLLVAAIVERRGSERFALIAQAHPDADIQRFYRAIANSEDRHWQLFVDLAIEHCPNQGIEARLDELIAAEAQLMASQPLRAALH